MKTKNLICQDLTPFLLAVVFIICKPVYAVTYIYAWGGLDSDGNISSAVYRATVLGGGALGIWTSVPSLPQAIKESWGVAIDNNIFSMAGAGLSGDIPDVYVTQANSSGSISGWSSATNLPQGLYQPCIVKDSSGTYLCSLGGAQMAVGTNFVYTASVSGSTIGPWIAQTPFPQQLTEHLAVSDNGYIYVIGNLPVSNLVRSASFSGGILGTWQTITPLPVDLAAASAIAWGGYLYVFGGLDTTSIVSTVYVAQILGSGNIGAWTTTTSLPTALCETTTAVVGNYVFIIAGGNQSGNEVNTVYSAPLLTGGIGSWSNTSSLPAALVEMSSANVEFPSTVTPTVTRTSTLSFTTTYTVTPTPTATATCTSTWTSSITSSTSATATATVSASFSSTLSATQTHTPTFSFSITSTSTETATISFSSTITWTATPTCPVPCQTPPFLFVDRNIFNPSSDGVVRIGWNFGRSGKTKVSIYNSAGELVRKLEISECFNNGVMFASWDGRNREGKIVASNVYVIAVMQAKFLRYTKVAVRK